MKKKVTMVICLCLMTLSVKAQFQYDRALPLPTVDLYDTGVMNMYFSALAQTAARRQQQYEELSDQAIEAFNKGQWNYAISYVNQAFRTGYYCGMLYYVRGFAYESLGDFRSAKKDYKAGKKYNSVEAAQALELLKVKMKQRRQ